jgi:hypothetical protein
MLLLVQLVAAVLTLLPVAVVVALSSRRNRALWQLAAAIPAAVALDLLSTLVLCRIVRLEIAAFVSRGLWLGVGAWLLVRQRRRLASWFELPAALDRRALAALGLAALSALLLSLVLSRPYAIWDRELHIPLVSAMRGERIPFASPFEPGTGLHYHFAGNVLAAMVQTFSFAVLNASLALSLAHDLVFVLIALVLGLSILASGRAPVHVVVLGVAAVLLSGPCVLRFGVGEPFLGYSSYSFFHWAFRPANNLALLMLSGVVPVLMARGCEPLSPDALGRQGLGSLAAIVAILAITDETATAVLGLCLGIAWLADWRILGPRRRDGAILLAVLAVAFVGTNLLFDASLTFGTPAVTHLAFVVPRMPGVQQPALPLDTQAGWIALIADTVPVWAIAIAIAVAAPMARRHLAPRWPGRSLLAFVAALFVVSIAGMISLEGNKSALESYRFLTAALWIFPVIGALALDWWPPGTLRRVLVFGALGLGAFSTLLWLSHYPKHPTPERWFRKRGPGLHDTSCRTVAGAHLGEKPVTMYIESSVFYSYAGCHPGFVAGQRGSMFEMKLRPTLGLPGFQELDQEMLKPDETVDAICPAGRAPNDVDPVCAYALTRAHCEPEGTAYLRCPLAPADRRAILGHR